MVRKRQLKIKIDKEGVTHIEVLNAEGQECLEWTQEIEAHLGGTLKRELKESYYADQNDQLHQGT
jgi:hypothetical protein